MTTTRLHQFYLGGKTLAYGALDELASGCWSREGGSVTLVASKFETSMEDEMKFDRLELRALPAGKFGAPV